MKFAVAYPTQGNREPAVTKETAPMLAGLWSESLADVPTEALEPAFRATLQSSKWFPTIADIRSHVENAYDALAEDEWQNVLEYVRRHFYPDPLETHALAPEVLKERFKNYVPSQAGPPRLPADIAHAAAAAGGLRYLESCPTDELQWAKKRFVEDLTRQRKSGDIAPLLGDSPLSKLLERTAQRLALPSASPPASPGETRSPLEVLRSLRDAPNDLTYGAINRPGNPEFIAWQKRRAEHDLVAAEYCKRYGLSSAAAKTPAPAEPQPVDSISLDLAANSGTERTDCAAKEVLA